MMSVWKTSYFDLSGVEYLIVGSGIVGLWCAELIKQKHPSANVVVIDKDVWSSATLNNAGFLCVGSCGELEEFEATYGSEITDEIISMRLRGLVAYDILTYELADVGFSYGGAELVDELDEQLMIKWQRRFNSLKPYLRTRDYNMFEQDGMIVNAHESTIDMRAFVTQFKSRLERRGIKFLDGYALLDNSGVIIKYPHSDGLTQYRTHYSKKDLKIIWCGNVLPDDKDIQLQKIPVGIFDYDSAWNVTLNPGWGYHAECGQYFWRLLPDNKLLFGGGRKDYTKARSAHEHLEYHFRRILDTKARLKSFWIGSTGFSSNPLPVVEKKDGIWYATNTNGMGMTLAPIMAKNLVEIL
jgi:glycine/D-amino acid oxidase-like deaminating enzyme